MIFVYVFVCVCIKALALTSEAYFSALAKMGEQALNTLSSRSLGKIQNVCFCVTKAMPVGQIVQQDVHRVFIYIFWLYQSLFVLQTIDVSANGVQWQMLPLLCHKTQDLAQRNPRLTAHVMSFRSSHTRRAPWQ